MTDIFTSIRDVATGSPKSAEIAGVLYRVTAAVSDARAWRAEFEATAVNPLVDTAEAQRAQDEIAKSLLNERRLEAALTILEPKLVETEEAERQAKLLPPWEKLRRQRETLLKDFRRDYAQHASAIVDALRRMKELDNEINAIETPADRESIEPFLSTLSLRFVHLLRLPEMSAAGMLWGDDPNRVRTMGELVARVDNSVQAARSWP